MRKGHNAMYEDRAADLVRNLAHEIGHLLDLRDEKQKNRPMYEFVNGGKVLNKSDVMRILP
jgi:hypothetical protein